MTETKNKGLQPGEKYLSIKLLGGLDVVAFPNKDKKVGDNKPDFKGDGVAVWINKKKIPQNDNNSNQEEPI